MNRALWREENTIESLGAQNHAVSRRRGDRDMELLSIGALHPSREESAILVNLCSPCDIWITDAEDDPELSGRGIFRTDEIEGTHNREGAQIIRSR